VFENLLGQSAAGRLVADIEGAALAPAMLFSGPPASGKGTAALELARVISCEAETKAAAKSSRAAWKCPCASCSRHRLLIHPDLLCLGYKPFSAEIAASASSFLREAASSAEARISSSRILFIRSVRKLLARFNPVLWEDEPKAGKISPMVNSLEEDLDDLAFLSARSPVDLDSVTKLTEDIIKGAFKLQSEGMSETVPIGQIRRAAVWSRLAPLSGGKLLVIENAHRMQDEARNSLLKLLEEPPGRLTVVLTAPRPGSLIPTIVSRLRHYAFNSREAEVEREVIRRVFKDEDSKGGIGPYLDSFLPVSSAALEALAAFFAASAACRAAFLSKKQGRPISGDVVLLGKTSAPKAEAAGLGGPREDTAAVINLIIEKAEKFELRSLFSRFLSCLLEQVSMSRRAAESLSSALPSALPSVSFSQAWRECSNWAETAAGIYNLRPAQVLEKLFIDISLRMAQL
jgi:DNA polymerase-3 subunit gamma/tau